MDSELCTSDTHSVNTIAMSAMNSLGRYTGEREIYPHVDKLIRDAIANMEYVRVSDRTLYIEDFYTWGEHSFENILKMAEDIGRIIRHVIPFVIAAAFIIAAWVIYTV
jgi:predicted neutral ceramidase superfamily lipid hydrolase